MARHIFKQFYSFLFAFGLLLAGTSQCINIILDLGNVIIRTDSLKSFALTGHAPFLWYAGYNWRKLPHIKRYIQLRLYRFMHTVKPYDAGEVITKDEHNNRLPQLMYDWFRGTYSPGEIRTMLLRATHTHADYFKHEVERRLMRALITFMFTPERLTQALYLEDNAHAFVQKCKDDGHKLYVLSNFDAQSFELLHTRYQSFFNLFDGMVISGHVHTIKPCTSCFTYLFETYDLDPTECIFIDDRIENRQKGTELGMTCFFKQKQSWWTPWKHETDFDATWAFIAQHISMVNNQ